MSHRTTLSDLDIAHPLPLYGLTSYQGCSSLAPAIARGGVAKMDRELATPKRPSRSRRYVADRALRRGERGQA